ncbi:peroxisomal membrane protein Pex17 [Coccidioides immitis RS]|uniref:Peroxisomal membrane protein Pex17 n=1 Tax=Coccidioides immitis (strain RS) TaxID=246410 RepID=J3KHW9_COCIM|nr:peroxisomal membrane protein Pex17 [Coccidioides immitis RS]EAS35503.3 peroxisomal membrane protein Pex17 [Coccidioides immitis RS]
MGTERSLATLLRSLQTASVPEDAYRLLPSATGLLSLLKNPLNVSLLSSQLLCCPALWEGQVDLQTCRRLIGVFNSAAFTIVQHESSSNPKPPYLQRRGLEREEWLKAVVNGADDKSPRWRHLLLIGGVLLGFEGQNRQSLSLHWRKKLESALIKGLQLSLAELEENPKVAAHASVLVLNYTFELLSDWERSQIDYDILLPILFDSAFFSEEGLSSGYFLGAIDQDVREIGNKKFAWVESSPTFRQVNTILSRPLITSLGPLSRLIAHSVDNARNQALIAELVDLLLEYSRTALVQWRQNKLSEVDMSEEAEFLDEITLKSTLPTLWRLLKTSLFSMVIVLRAAMGRVLNDPVLAADRYAPYLASKTLQILRNLSFITGRLGHNSSSHLVFVNLTSLDILSQYPALAQEFLENIRPSDNGQIPAHPVDRCLDLFFLNTAEHFTLILTPDVNERLLVSAALPYLAAGGNNNLLEIFEAAHSVVLAVLAAPKSADMAAKHLPYYVDTLFNVRTDSLQFMFIFDNQFEQVFPQNLSVRQFRLAFKTILQITAPPSPLANSQPLLPSILLQLLYDRALTAPTTPLPHPTSAVDSTPTEEPLLSEQAVLTLTIIDCLCYLRVDTLEEWLNLAAHLISQIEDRTMRSTCQERLWDALSSGEMDVERAYFCVTWWSTRGGREKVLFGAEEDVQVPYMSGALGTGEPEPRESKL